MPQKNERPIKVDIRIPTDTAVCPVVKATYVSASWNESLIATGPADFVIKALTDLRDRIETERNALIELCQKHNIKTGYPEVDGA